MEIQAYSNSSRPSWRHYIGIFLLALATLLLELSLTRVLSVATWHHFGFLVISTALLGFGASGVVLTLWTGLRERMPLDRSLAILCISFGVVTILSFWLMQQIPFNPFKVAVDRRQLAFIPLYYLALAAPFFCAGLAIALLFTRFSAQVNRLYAADLIGAGIGCAAVALVMPAFGGSGSVAIAAMLGMLAAVTFVLPSAKRLATCAGVLAALALALAWIADRALPISVLPDKGHPLYPRGQKPLYTEWNTFSRIDVYDLPAMPETGWPTAGFSLVIDAGSAAAAIGDLRGGVRNFLANNPEYRPPGLPYIGKKHPKVLIIGSGAGREVLEALYYGASSITAVEINPIINDIVTRRMREHWGGLFELPEVHLVTEDGRSFVRRSQEKYDAIISIQTMSANAITSGALTLSETYVLTREAFEDYFDHLTPDGVLLITRPPQQLPKLFATAREIFESRGLGSPKDRLLAFDANLMAYGARRIHSGFFMKKSPITAEELETLKERLEIGRSDFWTGRPAQIYYPAPERRDAAPDEITSALAEILSAPDPRTVFASNWVDYVPATDNRPFFNQPVKWSSLRPWMLRRVLLDGYAESSQYLPVAQVTLIVVFVQVAIVAAFLILLPLGRLSREGAAPPHKWSFLTFFAGLGFGFIMIEIVFLQWFSLFLGEPVYTYAVVLASLLIFTGAGSFLSARFPQDARRALAIAMICLVGVLAVTTLATPRIFAATLGFSLAARVAIAVAVIAPLGVMLGIPFATGMRIVAEESAPLVPLAWGVNGFCTVIGSVGAMILAMIFGYRIVLAVAGVCYLGSLAAILIPAARVRRLHVKPVEKVAAQVHASDVDLRRNEVAVVGH
jgi:SAM-dependent methyltransferase